MSRQRFGTAARNLKALMANARPENERPGGESRPWYRIVTNQAAQEADVYLFDEIGWYGVTASNFVEELANIVATSITLHINSPGGDVFDGIAIMNAILDHPASVTAKVDGLAASAASFVAMAGDKVVMGRNAQLMIHDASGMCWGNPDDMRKMAQTLDMISDNIASIYAERTGGTVEDWRAAMRAESWYGAQEAVDAGLADAVAPGPGGSPDPDAPGEPTEPPGGEPNEPEDAVPAHRFSLAAFRHAGRQAAPAPFIPQNATPTLEPEPVVPPRIDWLNTFRTATARAGRE